MNSYFSAILFGSVQGVTEFLPISSSGHLALLDALLPGDQLDLTFLVFTHGATLCAILIALRSELRYMLSHVFVRNSVVWKLLVATLPVGIAAVLFASHLETWLSQPWMTGIALCITAITLWIADTYGERTDRSKHTQMGRTQGHATTSADDWRTISWKQAVFIGFLQMFAIVPGISRSGISMAAGRLAHLSRQDAATYSFLLGIPTIAAAIPFTIATLWSGSTSSVYGSFALVLAALSAFGWCLASIPLFRRHIAKGSYRIYSVYTGCLGVGMIAVSVFS